jgi:hypothetical protein
MHRYNGRRGHETSDSPSYRTEAAEARMGLQRDACVT